MGTVFFLGSRTLCEHWLQISWVFQPVTVLRDDGELKTDIRSVDNWLRKCVIPSPVTWLLGKLFPVVAPEAPRLRAPPLTGDTCAPPKKHELRDTCTSKQRAERFAVLCVLKEVAGWISRWLPPAMETYGNSHKKQKLSNATENWVSCRRPTCVNSTHRFITSLHLQLTGY